MSQYGYVDAYGRPVAYNPAQSAPQYNNARAYKDELKRRLEELDRQYPESYVPPVPQNTQPVPQLLRVKDEKDVENYPLDYTNPGAIILFVKEDESVIFAKRLNTSTGKIDTKTYVLESINDIKTPEENKAFDFTSLLPLVGTVTTQIDDISSGISEIKELLNSVKSPNDTADSTKLDKPEASRSKGNSRTGLSNGEAGESS